MTGWKSPGRRLPMKGVSAVKARQIFGKGGGDIHECERVIYLFSLRSCPPQSIRWFLMSEAIITRRGKGTNGGGTGKLVTETIIANTNWTVPKAINNLFSVRIFGGGGGGGYYYRDQYTPSNSAYMYIRGGTGGGGGWMNNGDFELQEGRNIQIVIGAGGDINNGTQGNYAGGTSAFGGYLSANGGEGGSYEVTYGSGGSGGAGGGGSSGGVGYQFGGVVAVEMNLEQILIVVVLVCGVAEVVALLEEMVACMVVEVVVFPVLVVMAVYMEVEEAVL